MGTTFNKVFIGYWILEGQIFILAFFIPLLIY